MSLDTPVVVGSVTIATFPYPIYGTSLRANEYFAASLDTSFTLATADNQNKSLVMARRWLDRQTWLGTLTVANQPTAFPRTGIEDKEGNSVDPTLVPLGIEFAEYELALILIKDPSKFNTTNTSNNTKKAKAGEAEIEFFRTENVDEGLLFPDQVMKLVSPFLFGSADTVVPFYFGGTCNPDSIVSVYEFGFNEGMM